jgi:riboflavin kinase/FMN adenylyltransferase
MNIIRDLNELSKPLRNPVLTIGNFDGVHRGHLALFEKIKRIAGNIDGQSAVMTFEPHPIKIVKPGNGPPLITPIKQKLELISNAGIDIILCLPFTTEFAEISAQEFVMELLVDKIGIRELVVGYDYSFGRNREGDIELLRKMGKEAGFKVHVVEPIHLNGTLISSTSIRNLVQEGDLSEAKRLLGRDYQITGVVEKGMGRGGKVLGFPTANLTPVDELIPQKGVYAVKAIIDDNEYDAVCNIGINPTFGGTSLSIETHVLDFSGDILGKDFTIRFIKRLRDEKTFSGKDELAKHIENDITLAREILGMNEQK